jgi:predicted ArsR family transcriptional regulator
VRDLLEKIKAERLRLMNRALEIVEKAGKPVSIDYVAYHLGISWHAARALLLELVARGKLKMIDTTKSYIFMRGDI